MSSSVARAAELHDAHITLGWASIIANGIVGVWALGAHFEPRLRHRAGWVAVGVAEVMIVAQVVLGVVYQNVDDVEAGSLHQLYGFTAFVSVGIIYAYRNEMRERPHLLYGLGSLWLVGLGIRALIL